MFHNVLALTIALFQQQPFPSYHRLTFTFLKIEIAHVLFLLSDVVENDLWINASANHHQGQLNAKHNECNALIAGKIAGHHSRAQ